MERNAASIRAYLYGGPMPEGLTTTSLEWAMMADRDPKHLQQELAEVELQLSEDDQ